MHLPAASLAVRVFRLILYWKRILISGSSTIGNGHSLQAHLVLDNSSGGLFCRMIRMMRDFTLPSGKSLPINAVYVLEQGGIG